MNLHTDALPPQQQQAILELGGLAGDHGFYLAGGTAVGLHLGHRRSIDLDWFANETFDDPMKLAKEFQDRGVILQIGGVQRGALYAEVRGVRVTFLEFRYPLLKPPQQWAAAHCPIASLDDLAAMKLLAVAQRGAKKDFVDVYALGKHGYSLADMVASYQEKFSTSDVARVAYSLCYFDDADREPMPEMLIDATWNDVKKTIREWVRSLADSSADG